MKQKTKSKSITGLLIAIICALCLSVVSVNAASSMLSTTSTTVVKGKTVRLSVANGSGSVKWKSANTKIAKVSSKGVVTGKKTGTTTITATVNQNTLKCRVKVISAPAKPKVTSVSNENGGVTVKWKKISNASGYKVYRKAGNGKYTCIATISNNATVSYTDKKASSGKSYTYAVSSTLGTYTSARGATKSIKYLASPSISRISNTNNSVTIKWNKISGCTGYKVYRKTGSGSWKCITTIKKNATVSYTNKNVTNVTAYSYAVRAYNGKYLSAYSDGKSVTPPHTHSYTRVKEIAATCGKAGSKTYSCSCGASYTQNIPALSHNYVETARTVSTCKEAGKITYTCKNCGSSYDKALAIGNHKETSRTVKTATCTQEGIQETYCTICGKTFSRVNLPKTTHKTADRVTKKATCTETGIKETYCTVCNTVLNTEVIAKTDHQTKTTTVAATCEKEGSRTVKCTLCGEVISVTSIPATGHTEAIRTITNATNTSDGTREVYCKTCNEVLRTEVIPATGHTYELVDTKDATCTEDGYKKYSCTHCDDSYTDNIPATGHTLVTKTVTEATCSSTGKKQTECSVCGTVTNTEVIAKLSHTPVEVVAKAATCTEKGILNTQCDICGEVISSSEIAAVGHKTATRITKEANCEDAGTQETYCTVCGEVLETTTIKRLGHDYVEESKAATCTEDGYEKYTCSRCGDVFEMPMEALGHTEKTDEKAATCTEDGYKKTVCTVCGEVISQETYKAAGHDYQVTDQEDATCEEDGHTVYTCTKCKDSYTEVIKAAGHNYTKTLGRKGYCNADGSLTDGYYVFTCENCGNKYTEMFPAPDHVMKEVSRKEATCTTDGSITYKCENCGYWPEDEVIPALGHNYKHCTKEPELFLRGYSCDTCTRCNHEENKQYIDPLAIARNKEYTVDLGNGQTDTVTGFYMTDYRDELFNLVNKYRTDNGISELLWDDGLQASADIRAVEIAYSFSHTRPNGQGPSTASVSDVQICSENIQAGGAALETPVSINNRFIQSSAHLSIMSDDYVKHMAVSVFAKCCPNEETGLTSYALYIVEDFSLD